MSATLNQKTTLNMTLAKKLAQQLGVVQLLQIIQHNPQPISLDKLAEIFHRESEQEERLAVGVELSAFLKTLQTFPTMFVIEIIPPEIRVRMSDHANICSLTLLSGIIKLQAIVKQKERLNIRQLSTFFNQQSSREERQVLGKNPATLNQTIRALPSVFNMIGGDFITLKLENPPKSSEDKVISVDGRGNVSQFQNYPRDAPISYASAVTVHTMNDDEQAQVYRACISKLRNHLVKFGTSTIFRLDDLLASRGTLVERRALGESPESLVATLKALPDIFSVNEQFVGLIDQAAEVSALAKVTQFLKSKGNADMTQISGFMGQQGMREEREAVGKNPSSLSKTINRFQDVFTLNGRYVSLKSDRSGNKKTFDGKMKPVSPVFQIKHTRTRDESIGVDSGFEGSVITCDLSDDSEGSGDTDLKHPPSEYNGKKYNIIPKGSSSTHNTTPAMPAPEVIGGQPTFIMVDVAGTDTGFSEFKQEFNAESLCDKPVIIGIAMSEDLNWMAISCWGNTVYLVDMQACLALVHMETCLTLGGGDAGGVDVCSILKDLLQSTRILKVVYDCRWMASSLHQKYGYDLTNVFDTMIAHQLLTCDDSTGLDELCSKYGGVTPPGKWCATIGGLNGWKVLDLGGATSDGLAPNARVLVPHLYQQMTARFKDGREKEIVRLCAGVIQTSHL